MTDISIISETFIHPTAIIEENAVIGSGTKIGPYSIIKNGVKIGANNDIASHVIIEGDTVIGDGNKFFAFAAIGSRPQIIDWRGGRSQLIIGDNNVIREYVTLQPGVEHHGGVTRIGNGNFFMISSHVGHDTIIGDNNRFTNAVGISGHVNIGNNVIIGGFSGVHQFVNLGDHAFIAAGSIVTMDVPPFCMAQGNHAHLIKINTLGLTRSGFSEKAIAAVKDIFRRLIYSNEGLFAERQAELVKEYGEIEAAQCFFDFINNSSRGICPYKK